MHLKTFGNIRNMSDFSLVTLGKLMTTFTSALHTGLTNAIAEYA